MRLELDDVGRIEAGPQADFAVLESADWRDLLYTMAINPIREVWSRGTRIAASAENANANAQRERAGWLSRFNRHCCIRTVAFVSGEELVR